MFRAQIRKKKHFHKPGNATRFSTYTASGLVTLVTDWALRNHEDFWHVSEHCPQFYFLKLQGEIKESYSVRTLYTSSLKH